MKSASKRELRGTAIHEAGHAVAAAVLGRFVRYVRLHDDGTGIVRCGRHPRMDLRGTHGAGRRHVQRMLKREIVIAWAGIAAERHLAGRRLQGSHLGDARMIDGLLRQSMGTRDKGGRELLGAKLWQVACQLIASAWPAVVEVSRALLKSGTLSGTTLRRIVRDHSRTAPSIGG